VLNGIFWVARRNPRWQTRGQLSGVRQTRINPNLAAC